MSTRVRFAPSPTGQVHIGNIRTAIFNWLFARHEGGQFLLRIEDTDRERSTPEAVQTVMDALSWLGLDHDEEPLYQSTRMDAHLTAAEELLSKGLAYKEDKGGTGKGECVIFRMPGTDVNYHDIVKGDLKKEAKDMQDFVIVRSNGTPVFHLANVIDDIHMNITHIMRGDDHVENTYRHIALYNALGAEPPKYAHFPMIVNAQGKPYSKRDGDAFVGDFRTNGFLGEALLNYLTFLGWSPGDDREIMNREELVKAFTLDRVRSSASQMDIRKLTHLNGMHIAELPADDFLGRVRHELKDEDWAASSDADYFHSVCELMQSRTKLLPQVLKWKQFFSSDFEYEEKAVRKVLKKEGIAEALTDLREKLQGIDFADAAIEQAIREVETARGMKEGKLNQPMRVAITGQTIGAGVYETAALLGKDRVIGRIDRALNL
jgi:glutamyl-tRNA synthetase